jgi:hypothetical protein
VTYAGHGEAILGQNQDNETPETLVREGLDDDLRVLIRAGKNLETKHCAQLKVLPALELTLASATMQVGILSRDTGPPEAEQSQAEIQIPAPLDVREVLRKSLQRLLEASTARLSRREDFNPAALDPPVEAKYYYEVRMRLFGLSPRTSFMGPGDRWDNALDYYNEHINSTRRSRPAQKANFYKRIFPKELLAPLIETLLRHEGELMLEREQMLLAVSTSADAISLDWEEKYWWFFRMAGLLNTVWWNVECAIRIRRELPFDDMTRLPLVRPDEEVFPGDTERVVQFYIKDALYSVAIIWRFIRYEGWPTGWADIGWVHVHQWPKLHLSEILTAFATDFSFSPPDHDWLDLALDDAISAARSRSADLPATGEDASAVDFNMHQRLQLPGAYSAFIDRLGNDPAGQLVLARFAALVDTCRCFDDGVPPPDPRVCWHCGMHRTPPDYVIPPQQWECVFHKLRRKAGILSDFIEIGWLGLARNQVEWGVGGVPPVDDYIDEP